MKNKQIVFSEPNKAELVIVELPDALSDHEVLVKMAYTAVSAGTERANLVGDPNINSTTILHQVTFPRELGYSGTGIVEKIGSAVTSVLPGDRVIVYFGKHKQFNLVSETNVIKIIDDTIGLAEASLIVIACFSIEGLRKTKLEIGESALVAGLGILGLFAVQMCRIAGAVPIIASDFSPIRRQLALELGADYALDPASSDYVETVKAMTNEKSVNIAIEVTGAGAALIQTLGCMSKFGRVSLLGCTRSPVDNVDFYHLVHGPGITLIGANHFARPLLESSHGSWTARDDCIALMKLMLHDRLNFSKFVNEIHTPLDAHAVYHRLAYDYSNFPIGVLFDWGQI